MESATDASPRARDDVFDQDALDEDPRRVGDTDTLGYIEPQLPLRLAGPQEPTAELPRPAETSPPAPKIKNLGIAHRDDETEDERAARARVPSWDDILMGVRRKQD
jgi:hypothetical protein